MASVPYVSVQPDYPEVVQDVAEGKIPSEKTWLSVYASNAPEASVHARLVVEQAAGGNTVLKSDTSALQVEPRKTGIRVAVVGKGVAELNGGRSRSVYVRQGQIRQRVVNVLFAADSRRLNVPKIRAPAGIQAFDVSPTNDLYVAGGNDGELVVGTLPGLAPAVEEAAIVGASDIEQRARHRMAQLAAEHEARQSLNLTGHLGDVRSARFFPSGEVILTTSSDMSVRIFSARENSNPRVLQGHKRAVLSSEILGRGRQVLTGGADGTVRLWDVGKGVQITSYAMPKFSSANGLALPRPQEASVLAVALASGAVQLIDVRVPPSPTSPEGESTCPSLTGAGLEPALHNFPPKQFDPSPSASVRWNGDRRAVGGLQALSWASDENRIVTGSSQGVFSLVDPRMVPDHSSNPSDSNKLAGVVTAWERSTAEVTDLQCLPNGELLAASADGLPHRARIPFAPESADELLTPEVLEEFAGWDASPTNAIRVDRTGRVVVAGADGWVRRY